MLWIGDAELEAEVLRLATGERSATASLVAHLAELGSRRLHERAGFSSLFTYCLEVLRLSEHEAYDRMKAAHVARRYPQVLEWLAAGDLNLTTVRLLAPHLTRANHQDLFAAARGKRKRPVQEMLAARFPQPDVPSSVRKLPRRSASDVALASSRSAAVAPPGSTPTGSAASMASDGHRPSRVVECTPSAIPAGRLPVPGTPPPLIAPLSPDRYRITITVDGETRELLEQARDLLRHSIPSGDPAPIIARALQLLVNDLRKRKYALVSHPRGAKSEVSDPMSVRRVTDDAFRSGTTGAFGRARGPDTRPAQARMDLSP